jgi:ribonuclease D
MDKTIYSKFDKNVLNSFPIASFGGRIIVVMTEQAAEKAVDYLLSSDILGVDTETRPTFRKGQTCKVALLQVSNRDTCFLFRLNMIGLCAPVKRLLENVSVPMVGLSWHDDLHMLHKCGDFKPGRFIELQDMVGMIGIKDLSLQKIWANLFSQKISKRQRLTNWENQVLSDAQKKYAALDAWACIQIYEEIKRLYATHAYTYVEVPEVQPTEKQNRETA